MKRFYWENPLVTEVEVELSQIDGAQCTINPIIFHPDEGGQPPDKGTIGDANIIKIEAKDGQAVITLDKPLTSGKYTAKVEQENRLIQSQRHTAQHIISGIAEKKMGLMTIGVRIGETCTIDFDKKVEWDQAEKLEKLSNEAIMMDLPVCTEYGTIADRGRFDNELSGKDSEELRVVVIGDIDKSACCGTHVPSTGMIGSIRIIGLEASRQGSRITFISGLDSINFGIAESTVLRNLRKATSCANDELIGSFSKLQEQISQLNKENGNLWEKIIPFELEKAVEIASQSIPPSVVLFTGAPIKLLPKIAQMLSNKTGKNAFVANEIGQNITISSPDSQAKNLFSKLSATIALKGGGSPASVNILLEKPITCDQLIRALS